MSDSIPPKNDSQAYGRDEVVKIINSVIQKVEHTGDSSKDIIFKELQGLQKIIEDARKDIGAVSPSDINDKHIPTATDELDAIVGATAEATGTIMDCCEVIQEKAEGAGDAGAAITEETMKIFEACSFQDITGQRISNVVKTLKSIEEKVGKLIDVLGDKMPGIEQVTTAEEEDTRVGDERLLNGPQLPGNGVSQDDIDKILAEFD